MHNKPTTKHKSTKLYMRSAATTPTDNNDENSKPKQITGTTMQVYSTNNRAYLYIRKNIN